MNILIINSAAPDDRAFVGPIEARLRHLEFQFTTREWEEFTGQESIRGFDSIIISASPMGDNANFTARLKAFQWLKACTVPVLGICAGHQLIGHIFGADLIRNKEAEKGPTQISLLTNDPLFSGLQEPCIVEQQHLDSISLPEHFILLASSAKCRVQGMRHATLPIYGFQWHVEISSLDIIGNFIRRTGHTTNSTPYR